MIVQQYIKIYSSFGGRFFALNDCYDKKWRNLATEVAQEMEIQQRLHQVKHECTDFSAVARKTVQKRVIVVYVCFFLTWSPCKTVQS